MAANLLIFGVIAVLVVGGAYLAVSSLAAQGTLLAVQLTDPPGVPAGTQHLYVTYTGVLVHVEGQANASGYANTTANSSTSGSTSGWVSAQGSGTVDLMALANVSQTIASANVAANSTVNMVRFNISGISMVVNNKTYSVSAPNSQLTVAVVGSGKINSASSSAVLVDFRPTVTAHVEANATAYILVPAATAVVVNSGANATANANVGGITNISAALRGRLNASLG